MSQLGWVPSSTGQGWDGVTNPVLPPSWVSPGPVLPGPQPPAPPQVCGEKNRFEKLMEYFRNEDTNIDFMVSGCWGPCSAVPRVSCHQGCCTVTRPECIKSS